MKQKKHWKQILTGLIALTGFATFAITLASCGSNSNGQSSNVTQSDTIFHPALDATTETELSKLAPSEFNNDVNKPLLVNLILRKGLDGKKDNIKEEHITIFSIVPDDENGSLKITYAIKNHWENNEFVSNDKAIELTVSGFSKVILAKDTLFETIGNVSSYENLKNLLPSEAQTIGNQNFILRYIFDNLILGKKDGLLINNISFLNAVANDNNGTLLVNYSVQNYWINNVQISEIKAISVTLSGFIKQTSATEFKDSKQIDIASNVELSLLSTNELNANKHLLQKLLFDDEIFGNKQSLDLNNVVISNLFNEDSANGTISVDYQIDKYWSNKGLVVDNNKSFSINLIGFRKVNLSDEKILKEINYGGTYQGLTIDKFLPIIEHLQMSDQIRLNSITDLNLNELLKTNPNYADLNLEIISGNQSNQTLSLKISGTYKGVNIPNNQIINISGFYNSIDNYQEFSKFLGNIYITEMNFNLDTYFKNLQIESDIPNWTSNDWLKTYLSNMTISKYPVTDEIVSFDLLQYSQNKIFENIKFNNVAESISSKSWSSFNIDLSYANYKYNSITKLWEKVSDINSKTLNFKTASFLKFNVPTKQEAINWIAQNATKFDTTKTSSYYASYWYSLYQKNDIESINSLITIEDKYKLKYFDEKLMLTLDSMSINDFTGTMHISYKLDYNGSQFVSLPFSTSTETFKKLTTFIDANKSVNDNVIQIKVESKKSSLAESIIKSIKKDFTTQQLKAFKLNEAVDMKSKPILLRNTNSYRLYNGYASRIDDKLDESYIASSITPLLFGKQLSRSTIDVDKNLFISNRVSDNTTKFIINYISVNVDTSTKATLMKQDNTKFIYKVPFKYSLAFEGDSAQTIEISSYYYAHILNSDLGI